MNNIKTISGAVEFATCVILEEVFAYKSTSSDIIWSISSFKGQAIEKKVTNYRNKHIILTLYL